MKTEKKKLHFNWIDLVIVVLAAAVIGGIFAVRYLGMGKDEQSGIPVTCEFELHNVPNETVSRIAVGDQVSNSETGERIGEVTAVRAEPFRSWKYSAPLGEYREVVSEEESFVYLTVSGSGSLTAQDVKLSATDVRVGSLVYLKGKGYAATSYVTAVDAGEAESAVQDADQKGDRAVTFTMQCSNVRRMTAESFRVGEALYDEKNICIGTIQNVEYEPYFEYQLNDDGEAVKAEMPERYRVTLTLTGRCTEHNDGYFLGGVKELKAGSTEMVCNHRLITTCRYLNVDSVVEE